ncbi:hypothetical protein M409DRAFT_24689 [Zasmidium cellare ATCC 36951]|uniref:Zn(2)-C6 fungal-type domain-containing protein n=1 Tax=Zasmidium cellare ATCC 36951 TaxID=1080233 RepID=A0A6A6CC81_ZASCE|nr:uncharacterized protein M409DRAFT_24689 [Zasmidium cellare ATCC 36951]KAF2164784.1 hypothetical protein M409DRAFT_24689 [Zasmidium cellare ATCC 36951]
MINPNVCWTCKVRRKKCDERNEKVCENCEFLQITCHRGTKPEWMDGGKRQEEMAISFKREVRAHSHSRLAGRGQRRGIAANPSGSGLGKPVPSKQYGLPEIAGKEPRCPFSSSTAYDGSDYDEARPPHSETVLLSFYLDNVLPFLLPFYHPDPQREGGRAWILELASSSHVIRGVILSQSSYFFALSQGTFKTGWNDTVAQSANTFRMLHYATEVMIRTSVQAQLRGAVRVFTGIMQMQRFEVCVGSFENCRAHLDVALELCCDILACAKDQLEHPATRPVVVDADMQSCTGRLPDAERTALRMSTALILFDDVIASIVVQGHPRLSAYHEHLLGKVGQADSGVLRLDEVTGCPKSVLIEMGKIANVNALDCYDQHSNSVDSEQLAERTTAIRDSLQRQLQLLEARHLRKSPAKAFAIFDDPKQDAQRHLVARIWIHAALLQLSLFTSGEDPNNSDTRSHLGRCA